MFIKVKRFVSEKDEFRIKIFTYLFVYQTFGALDALKKEQKLSLKHTISKFHTLFS